MKPTPKPRLWLATSLCIWVLCAWVAQQPAPARKPVAARATNPKSAVAGPPVRRKPLAPAHKPVTVTEAAAPGGLALATVATDPETGLALDKNLLLVKGQCTACHSSKLILQSHFDREKWTERIRWMQKTQKLWDLGETEPAILTYLTTYYGPVATPFDGRRLPLAAPGWYRNAER